MSFADTFTDSGPSGSRISLLHKHRKLEARVGIGHLSPRLQGQNEQFSEGTKYNLSLLTYSQI